MFRSARKRRAIVRTLLPKISEYIAAHLVPETVPEPAPAPEPAFHDYRYCDEGEDYVYLEDDAYDLCLREESEPVEEPEPVEESESFEESGSIEEEPQASAVSAPPEYPRFSLSIDNDPFPDAFTRAFEGYWSGGRSESVRAVLDMLRGDTFSQKVMSLLIQKNLRSTKVYKAANLDRRLFSRMISDPGYQPSRDTALAVALALHLNLEQATDLLSRAGYALSRSDRRDIVIEYFFLREEYDLMTLNMALYDLGEKPIGYR